MPGLLAPPVFLETLESAVGAVKLAVGPDDEVVAGLFALGATYQPSPCSQLDSLLEVGPCHQLLIRRAAI